MLSKILLSANYVATININSEEDLKKFKDGCYYVTVGGRARLLIFNGRVLGCYNQETGVKGEECIASVIGSRKAFVQQFPCDVIKDYVSIPLATKPPEVWIGTSLYGFRVLDVIGRGGLAYVLKVERSGSEYAMKVLMDKSPYGRPLALGGMHEALREFLNEALTLLYLTSAPLRGGPDIVLMGKRYVLSVYGFFIPRATYFNLADYIEAPPAVVMELAPGKTLAEFDGLSYEEVMRIMAASTAGVAYMHFKGVIHGDMKPQNVIVVDRRGSVKIIDPAAGIMRKVFRMGTLPYVDPVAILDQKIEPRYDVFSLGVMIYQLLRKTRFVPSAHIPLAAALAKISGAGAAKGRALTGHLVPAEYQRHVRTFYNYLVKGNMASFIKAQEDLLDYDLERVPEEVRPILRRSLILDKKKRYRDAVEMLRDVVEVVGELP